MRIAPEDPQDWRKSSYSGNSNNDCVEVRWRKSSHSGSSGTDSCVEVAFSVETVGVRDSKNVSGPALAFTEVAWRAFASRL
jgi:hypothetical protein